MIRRYLYLMNQECLNPDWNQHKISKQTGLLLDDTTLIAMRRKINQ